MTNIPEVMDPSPSCNQADRLQCAGDRVGVWASLICAVHCALVPLLVALLPAFGLRLFGQIDFDQAFAVFATVLGVASLGLGYRRHRAVAAWLLLAAGLLLIWANAFTGLHDHSAWHALMMVAGGLSITAAHWLNYRLTHRMMENRLA